MIPKSYYVPEGGVMHLSFQHWEHTQNDIKSESGTNKIVNRMAYTLQWQQNKYKRTIILSKQTNMAKIWLAPEFREFETAA